MELTDLPFGEGDDLDAQEAETLVEARNVFLIAAEPVDGFAEDNVEVARLRISHELLDARAKQGRSGNPLVRVDALDGPALASNSLAAYAELILDRGFSLHIC